MAMIGRKTTPVGYFESNYVRTRIVATTNGQTSFPANYKTGQCRVYLNGVLLDRTDYNISAGIINLNVGVVIGDEVTVEDLTSFKINYGSIASSVNITTSSARIQGDFTNASVPLRTMFQTNTINGGTNVGFMPNGSGSGSGFTFYNSADVLNSAFFGVVAGGSDVVLQSGVTGTGTQLPIKVKIGAIEVFRWGETGTMVVGGGTPTPLWGSTAFNALESKVQYSANTSSGDAYFSTNAVWNGTNWKCVQTGTGGLEVQRATGGFDWYSFATATAGSNYTVMNNTLNLTASGNLTALGNVIGYSDETLKENWRPLVEDFVAKLAKVKYGVYDRIDTKETNVGVGAQSLEQIMSNAVFTGPGGLKGVAYGNAAMAACCALAEYVVALKAEIDELKANNG